MYPGARVNNRVNNLLGLRTVVARPADGLSVSGLRIGDERSSPKQRIDLLGLILEHREVQVVNVDRRSDPDRRMTEPNGNRL